MATATATLPSKNEQAAALRSEAAALQAELTKLREKLEAANATLGELAGKRTKLEQDSARGVQPKPGVVASLLAEIAEAQIPVNGLTPVVAQKQARLETVRATLETLNREIASEAAAARRQARFDTLRTQGNAAAARISEKLRALLEEDLPALDAVRDALVAEFVGGRYSIETGPEAQAARSLIHALERAFLDGSMMKHERALLRAGWAVRGDVTLTVRNLTPPKR